MQAGQPQAEQWVLTLQLVESFRNDSDQVRARVVANLGRLDKLTPEKLDPLINGLNRAIGRAENTASEVI